MFEDSSKAKVVNSIEFRQDIAKTLQNRIVNKQKINPVKGISIAGGKQAIFILDWEKSQLVYVDGILEMLGYTKSEFTLELALNCIHPEDLPVVNRIHRGVIKLAMNTDLRIHRQYLNVTLRLLKKDGIYLKVMCQSLPYQTDEEGRLISNQSVLTDISFMKANTNKVEWELFADNVEILKFKQSIYKEFENFFTPRELEIVHHIRNDLTNKKIAAQLFISIHTVITHRKNILKKSNCRNRTQLLKFCTLNGII